jgi:hypothetical protein
MPEVAEADSAVMDLWEGLRSSVAGEPVQVIFMWCEAQGLSAATRLEVWERVCLVDRVITGYHAQMAEAARRHQHARS